MTTPLRTILDQAPLVRLDELERLIEEAHGARLIDQAELKASLGEAVPLRARRRLVALLHRYKEEDRPLGTARTRSRLERGLLALIREHKLPRPLVNTKLLGFEVDFLWPHEKLIVETDGARWHGSEPAQARDAHRDLVLEDAGYRVIRLTWTDVFGNPGATAESLRAELSARR